MTSAHTSHRQTVQPNSVIKLMEAVGPTRAAQRLGVSTTLLHKSRKEQSVNKVVETAAAYALEHVGDTLPMIPAPTPKAVRGKESVFLVAVPTTKIDTFQRMAIAMGAELVAA